MQILSLPPKSFIAITGALTGAAVSFFLLGKNDNITQTTVDSKYHSADTNSLSKHSSNYSSAHSSNSLATRENVEISVRNTQESKSKERTKPTDTNKKRFWETADIPSELLAASLPIFESVTIPPGQDISRSTDLQQALEGLTGAPTGEIPDLRDNELLFLWLMQQPENATAWLEGQEDFDLYSHALALTASRLASEGDFQVALSWVNLIADPGKRRSALIDLYAENFSKGIQPPSELLTDVLDSGSIE